MGSLTQRLLRGGVWVLLGKGLTTLSTLAVIKLLANLVSQAEVGAYQFTFRAVMLAGFLIHLGLHQAVVRFVAQAMGGERPAEARAAITKAYGIVSLSALTVCAAISFGGLDWLAGQFRQPLLVGMGWIVALWMLSYAFQVLNSESFRGFKDLRRATLFGGVISSSLIVVVLGAFWLAGRETDLRDVLSVVVGCFWFSVTVSGVVLLRQVRGLPAAGSPPPAMVATALPMAVTAIAGWFQAQSDIFIVSAHHGDAGSAPYAVATLTVGLVTQSLILVNLVVPPFIADLHARGEREQLQRMLRGAATLAGIPAAAVLTFFALFGPWVMEMIANADYREGASVLAILAVGRLVNVFTGSCGITLMMTGHQKIVMTSTLIFSLASALIGWWIGARYPVEAIAWVYTCGLSAHNIVMWLAARKVTGLWTHVGWVRPSEIQSMLRKAKARKAGAATD